MFVSPIAFVPACLLCLAASIQDGPQAVATSPLQAQCDALFDEISAAYKRYNEGTHKAKTSEDAKKFVRPDGTSYAARFLAIAKQHPDDPVAVDALVRSIIVDFYGPHWKEAIERLRAKHLGSARIGPALGMIAIDTTPPAVEPLLREVLRQNPSHSVRADTALALARHLRRLAGEAENLREHPDRFDHAASRFGLTYVTAMRNRDPASLRRESEELYELAIREDARLSGDHDGPQSRPGEAARADLHSIRDLVACKLAPEVDGTDVDGKRMKLSDYRGKVVVLTFWATWCGPCMQMIPHERELVHRLEGKPFVLLGINGDEDRDRLRSQVKEHLVNWHSWYDGGPHGSISSRWAIQGWPTVFVLDRAGVIRYKGGRDEQALDEIVERLIRDSN
jgi:thiol-disulfide isomerase/thioredoxin